MITTKHYLLTVLISLLFGSVAMAATPSPGGAKVYFVAPADGAVVASPVTIVFGLRNMGVAPAGIDVPNTGHHHLLINVAEPPAADAPIPADARHRHFGGGQTEATIELPPGTHTLQLIMGDKFHVPLAPVVISEKISITVQ